MSVSVTWAICVDIAACGVDTDPTSRAGSDVGDIAGGQHRLGSAFTGTSATSRRAFLATVGIGAALGVAAGAGVAGVGAAAAQPTRTFASRRWGYITVPDGTRLRYSVLLPTGKGPFPVLMQYHGYDAGTIGGAGYLRGDWWMSADLDMALVSAGYAVVGVSMRGTGSSGGVLEFFSDAWGTDGAYAVEWAARQPWSSGAVGMYDWSWPGISQLFVAPHRPRGLTAIAPGMPVVDPIRDVLAPGGVPNGFIGLWWLTIQSAWRFNLENAQADGDAEGVANNQRNFLTGNQHITSAEYYSRFRDEFWAARDLTDRIAAIDVPVFSMTAWQDEEVGSRAGYFQELLDPARTWWLGTNGRHDTYVAARSRLIDFFDHFLRGERNGFDSRPHVEIWHETTSPEAPMPSDEALESAHPRWRSTFDTIPPAATVRRFVLSADGRLSAGMGRVRSGRVDYRSVPGPAVNFGVVGAITFEAGGPEAEAGWKAGQPIPGLSASFISAPLDSDLAVFGSASADLWISSHAPDTDVQVTVTEVRPDGLETYVQRGWLRVAQRMLDAGRSSQLRPVPTQRDADQRFLRRDVPVLARVEIRPFAHVFRAGSALRVVIDGPSPTGDWLFSPLAPTDNAIWCGGAHASSIAFGVVDFAPAPRTLPAPDSIIGQPSRGMR